MSLLLLYHYKSFRIVTCCVVTILTLSNIYIPEASVVESYFNAEGGMLELDEINPTEPDERQITVRLKAAREMTVHSLEGFCAC